MISKSADFRALYTRFGRAYRIDPRLIEGVIRQESNGNPKAFRYEPALNDASYGLMQVLSRTAHALGLSHDVPDASLCDPEVGVLYGVKVLADNLNNFTAAAQKMRQDGAFEKILVPLPLEAVVMLARYNGGQRSNPGPDGHSIRNMVYVESVTSKFIDVCKEWV